MRPARLVSSPSRLVAVLALAAALGCALPRRTASARKPSLETLPDGTQIVCQMEKPTGSHIPEQVCRKVVPAGLDISRTQTQIQLATPKSATPREGGP